MIFPSVYVSRQDYKKWMYLSTVTWAKNDILYFWGKLEYVMGRVREHWEKSRENLLKISIVSQHVEKKYSFWDFLGKNTDFMFIDMDS